MDLHGFTTSAASGCVCHELRLAALLQADKPEDRCLYSLTYRQQAVVLEQRSFTVTQAGSDILSFFLHKNDTIETFIQDVILRTCQLLSTENKRSPAHVVERARILRYGVQLPA